MKGTGALPLAGRGRMEPSDARFAPQRCAGDVIGQGQKTSLRTERSPGRAEGDAAVHGRPDVRHGEPRDASAGRQRLERHSGGRLRAVEAGSAGALPPDTIDGAFHRTLNKPAPVQGAGSFAGAAGASGIGFPLD